METLGFCLIEFSATKIVTWKHNVDESTENRFDMILGRYLLTALGLDNKFPKHGIIDGDVLYEECSAHMSDVTYYII